MTRLLLYVVLALVVSFVCSILEAVLLSVTPAFVRAEREKGTASGAKLYRLKKDVERPLAAILSLNTIANTIGAAGVGAEATRLFGNAWLGLVSGMLTLLILVFSEIIPKTLGAVFWRKLAAPAAHMLPVMIVLLSPLVWLARVITRTISRSADDMLISRDELTALTAMAASSEEFHQQEVQIIRHILSASHLKASDIMTPRTVVTALPQQTTVSQVLASHPTLPFSRLPVFQDSLDDSDAFVLKDEILAELAAGRADTQLLELARPILTVPDFQPLLTLFEYLSDSRSHIALVVDEHGGAEGVVTLEDVVESMLGFEIMDEADEVEDMQVLALRLQERRRARRQREQSSSTGKEYKEGS